MLVKLLPKHMYHGMGGFDHTAPIPATYTCQEHAVHVLGADLISHGAAPLYFKPDHPYCFIHFMVIPDA